MVRRLKIGQIKFTFVFRHRWDRKDEFRYNSEFRDYRIGLWFKKTEWLEVRTLISRKSGVIIS